ncbi:MAG: tetratricopeptide repeat protein [Caldilineaceae bacterium]
MEVEMDQNAAYAAFFHQSMLAMMADLTDTVQAIPHVPPPDVREQAVHLLDLALQLDESWPAARDLLLELAPKMEQAGHRDDWLPFLIQGINRSQRERDDLITAELHIQVALIYQLCSQLDLAYAHYSQAEVLFGINLDAQNQARALNRMGYVALLQQQYETAKNHINMALKLLPTHAEECAASYQVLGELALALAQWSAAEANFQKSLAIWVRYGDKRHIARRLRDLGNTSFKQQDFHKSVSYFEQSITLFGEVDDLVQQAIVRMNLGAVFLQTAKPTQALTCFAQSEPMLRKAQDIWHLGILYHNQGIAHRQTQEWKLAEKSLRTSIMYRQQIGHKTQMVNSLLELGLLYIDRASWREARETLESALFMLPEIVESHMRENYRIKITSAIELLNHQ